MRRNGYMNEAECSSSSGMMNTLLSLAGGVGIGAGLLYLLDPDKGVKRRQQVAQKWCVQSANSRMIGIGTPISQSRMERITSVSFLPARA